MLKKKSQAVQKGCARNLSLTLAPVQPIPFPRGPRRWELRSSRAVCPKETQRFALVFKKLYSVYYKVAGQKSYFFPEALKFSPNPILFLSLGNYFTF